MPACPYSWGRQDLQTCFAITALAGDGESLKTTIILLNFPAVRVTNTY